jgi:riboflavin synthase alpha subunit
VETFDERTGILVLRAWVEGDGDHPLRVRITRVEGRTTEPETSASVTVDGVCAVIRAWLEALLDRVERVTPPSNETR